MRYPVPVLCIAVWILLCAQAAEACSCGDLDLNLDGNWGELVFEGEVLDVTIIDTEACAGGPIGIYFLMNVLRVWSGDVTETVVMFTAMTSCVVMLEEGEKYLISASRYDGTIIAPGSCALFPSEDQVVARYGESVAPKEGHESLPVCTTGTAGTTEESQPTECMCVSATNRAWPGTLLALFLLVRAKRRR